MRPQEIDITKTIMADVKAVFRLLSDSSSWPEWTPIDAYAPVRPAGPDGLGEERVFRTGRVRVHERIVERVPERRLSYVLLDGLAVRDYRAVIDLRPEGGDTTLRWHTTFRAKVPGMGWIYQRVLLKATQQFVDGLAQHATETGASSALDEGQAGSRAARPPPRCPG